jgi:hypothetical protein
MFVQCIVYCVQCTLFPPVAEICARLAGNFCIVWTPFNKLGRIYGKKINESAKKSPSFLTRKSGSLGVFGN